KGIWNCLEIQAIGVVSIQETRAGGEQYDRVNVDIWGLQIYAWDALTVGNEETMEEWIKISSKPMLVSEYGADAWNSNTHQEDQSSQAHAAKKVTQIILNNLSADNPEKAALGGCVFSWADGWWKFLSGSPSIHDTGGENTRFGSYPDNVFNEEWWGMVDIDRIPRTAYMEIKNLYNPD
ncbi:MAG: hypothetical protein JW969_05580, partial [Spirochaetales bacterium]|nr:hypothetical protein [Spirochaetales bacterium]